MIQKHILRSTFRVVVRTKGDCAGLTWLPRVSFCGGFLFATHFFGQLSRGSYLDVLWCG